MSDNLDAKIATLEKIALAAANSATKAEDARSEIAKMHSEVAKFIQAVSSFHSLAQIDIDKSVEKKGKHLNSYLDDYYYFSGKASEINRSLALAGVAVVWIFKFPSESKYLLPIIPAELYTPLLCLVISLGLDLMHYFLGSIFWGLFYEVKLRRFKKNPSDLATIENLEAPSILSGVLVVVFFMKICVMVIAYAYLFFFVLNRFMA